MRTVRPAVLDARALLVAATTALLLAPWAAGAATWRARPGEAPARIAGAEPRDTVVLAAGVHPGPLRVLRPVVLRGEPGAVIDGVQAESALEIAAPGTLVEDLTVHGSGRDVMRVDAGVHVIACPNVTLRRVTVEGVLYGVYGERAHHLVLDHCTLTGTVAPRDESGTGNGIHLWNSDDALVSGCRVSRFLDAVYLSFARRAHIEDGAFADCGRYGLHTMYCEAGRLVGNRFAHNVAGCAIMFSNRLAVERNDFVHNVGPRTYGLLLRDCSDGSFLDNRIVDNTVGVFMDNSNRNRFRRNLLQDNGWGVLLFSSCARDTFAANDFIQNDYPVALDMPRTDNRFDDGATGNFWSENASYDLDGDGVSDVPFSPVTAFAFLSKLYPDLTILAKSPAVAALSVAERVLPSLRPSEAVDRVPRVAPVAMPRRAGDATRRPGSQPAWPPLVAYASLCGVGVLGLRLGRARRA